MTAALPNFPFFTLHHHLLTQSSFFFLYKLLNTVKLLKYFCRLSPPHPPVKEDTELFNTRMYETPTRVLRFGCTKVTKPAIHLFLLPPAPIVIIAYSYPYLSFSISGGDGTDDKYHSVIVSTHHHSPVSVTQLITHSLT